MSIEIKVAYDETEPFHVGRLREADNYVRRNHPDWEGDLKEHNGITVYSKAKWYRNRHLREKVMAVFCFEGKDWNLYVNLECEGGKVLLTLNGFAWGYGGEGPNGLACVLADIFPEKFADQRAALEEVARHRMSESWNIRR